MYQLRLPGRCRDRRDLPAVWSTASDKRAAIARHAATILPTGALICTAATAITTARAPATQPGASLHRAGAGAYRRRGGSRRRLSREQERPINGPGGECRARLETATDVPTATPSPTATPAPTATKPPAPKPTPVPQLVTLFYDPLTSNKYGWPTDSSACYFQSGGYHVINGAECEAPLKQQSNVNISVTVKQIAGSTGISYGIGFRVVSLDQNQYCFFINGLGNWLVFGSSGALVPPPSTSAIHRGLNATNTVEVDCSGSHFTFYINGVNVGSVSNGSISSGEIALGMEPDQSAVGTQVVFTNFKVTQWQ